MGEQIITAKRVITSEDIDRFADLSGDHFMHILKRLTFPEPCLKSRWRMVILS